MSGLNEGATHHHAHSHADGTTHSHPPALGPGHAPPSGGPVVVDIGGDVGAMIARMDESTWGEELFLRPDLAPDTTVHTGVWKRRLGSSEVVVAVFPSLREGGYGVLDDDGSVRTTVTIVGGSVAELDLR